MTDWDKMCFYYLVVSFSGEQRKITNIYKHVLVILKCRFELLKRIENTGYSALTVFILPHNTKYEIIVKPKKCAFHDCINR